MDFFCDIRLLIAASIQPNSSIKGHRISIVHSLDLLSQRSLLGFCQEISHDLILALDAPSHEIIQRIYVNSSATILFPDQIFTPDERLFIANSAQSLELEWHNNILLNDSIRDFLKLDRLSLAGYWLESVFELSLIHKLLVSEASLGLVVRFSFAELPIRQQRSGTFGHLIQHRCGEKHIRLFSANTIFSVFTRLFQILSSALKLIWFIYQKYYYKSISGKILFVANNAEQSYYAQPLLTLFAPSEISLIVNMHSNKNSISCLLASIFNKNKRLEIGIPVIPNLLLNYILESSLELKTLHCLKNLKILLSEEYAISKDPSLLILKRYVFERLPQLLASTQVLSDILSKYRPKSIIHTNALDYEVFQYNIISKSLALNTIVLSHGVLTPPQRSATFYGKYICGSKAAKTLLQQMHVRSCQTTILPSFNVEREYPTFFKVEISSTSKISILVLLDPVICNDRSRCYSAFGPVGYAEQISGLRILSSYIHDPRLHIAFKHHPGWSETELYSIASPSLPVHFLPPFSDLAYCAKQADLVVALNYLQAALIPVTCFATPVIHLITSPLLLSKKSSTIFRNPAFMAESGDVAVCEEQFSLLLDKFITSEAYRHCLTAKASAFYQSWFSHL